MINRNYIERSAAHTIYLVMARRISMGFSAEELSWLIGCEPGYVSAVEHYEQEVYGPELMQRIAKALEEPHLKNFYAKEKLHGKVFAEMETFTEGNELVHMARTLNEQDEIAPSYMLIEMIGEDQRHSGMNDEDYNMAMAAIKLLKDSGYFYELHTNQEIFERIKQFLPPGTLSPFYLREALNELSTSFSTALVLKVDDDKMGAGYIEN
jgi:transcriptional regulator with XRE-family HTH domain